MKAALSQKRYLPSVTEARRRYAHGTHARYALGKCRCRACKDARTAYERKRHGGTYRRLWHMRYSPPIDKFVVRNSETGEILRRTRSRERARALVDRLNAEVSRELPRQLISAKEVVEHVAWLQTNVSAVKAENCIVNDVLVCILDYLGNLRGLRSAGDGPGMPIPIVGGPFGDVTLEIADAQELARLFSLGQSMLIDLSDLSPSDQQWLSADFFNELIRVLRRPAHVIVEEAESICPAFSRSKSQFASQGAATRFARQIRNYGVGWTFSTQQPQLLHPVVPASASAYIAMRSTGDQVQHAILKEIKTRVGAVIASAITSELGSLGTGDTWLITDPEWLRDDSAPSQRRIHIRKRSTHDSTAVPKIGEKAKPEPPRVTADVSRFEAVRRGTSTPNVTRKKKEAC